MIPYEYEWTDLLEEPDEGEADEDEWPRCGCRYCYCMEHTPSGGPCDDCWGGAHQG